MYSATSLQHFECPSCGLCIDVSQAKTSCCVHCPRCQHQVFKQIPHLPDRLLALCFSAVIFWLLSQSFHFVSLSSHGHHLSIHIGQIVAQLLQLKFSVIAVFAAIVLYALPLLLLMQLVTLALCLKLKRWPQQAKRANDAIKQLSFWNMIEIFLIAVLVSMVKMGDLADVSIGLSFWAFIGFVIAVVACISQIDHAAINRQISQQTEAPQKYLGVQAAWAFLITGLLLYVPANALPIMATSQLGNSQASTILGGVITLWQHQSYAIALVILVASILVPIAKFIAIFTLLLNDKFVLWQGAKTPHLILRITELVGRWSMVDVFVVMFLAGFIQLGNLISIVPGQGAICFGLMVIATMLSAASYDPKRIWRDHG